MGKRSLSLPILILGLCLKFELVVELETNIIEDLPILSSLTIFYSPKLPQSLKEALSIDWVLYMIPVQVDVHCVLLVLDVNFTSWFSLLLGVYC